MTGTSTNKVFERLVCMLDEVFQGIYSSVVEAQNTIEQHYLGEITEDYFLEDGTPKMILVKLPRYQVWVVFKEELVNTPE